MSEPVSVHPVGGVDYPRTFQELLEWLPDNASCLAYLERLRWPNGFVCTRFAVPRTVGAQPAPVHDVTGDQDLLETRLAGSDVAARSRYLARQGCARYPGPLLAVCTS